MTVASPESYQDNFGRAEGSLRTPGEILCVRRWDSTVAGSAPRASFFILKSRVSRFRALGHQVMHLLQVYDDNSRLYSHRGNNKNIGLFSIGTLGKGVMRSPVGGSAGLRVGVYTDDRCLGYFNVESWEFHACRTAVEDSGHSSHPGRAVPGV